MGIKKAPNEFTGEANIFDGARTLPGVTLMGNNYAGGIRGI